MISSEVYVVHVEDKASTYRVFEDNIDALAHVEILYGTYSKFEVVYPRAELIPKNALSQGGGDVQGTD